MPTCADLATKAELNQIKGDLQELRDQINGLLGKTEDGSNTIDVLRAGTLQGTQTFALLTLAGTAIQKIVVQGDVGRNILEAIATGGAKFEAIKGNGAKSAIEGLNNLGKGAAKNLTKIKGLGGAVASNAGAIFNVASLSLGIGNSALAIGNLKLTEINQRNNDFAFNALARDYSNMMGFVSKNKSDITIAQAVNATNKTVIEEQKNINTEQQQSLLEQESYIASLQKTNKQQVDEIKKANTLVANYRSQVEELDDDIIEFKEHMMNQVIDLESVLVQTESINADQTASIEYLTRYLNAQQTHIDGLELQIQDVEQVATEWETELQELRIELGLDEPPPVTRGSIAKKTIYRTKSESKAIAGGGGAASARTGAARAQTGVLDLASKIAGTITQTPTITDTDISNRTTTFENTLANLIGQINIGATVQPQDIQDIRDGVKLDMESLFPALLGLTIAPSLTQLKNQTSASAIAAATTAGVCDSTKPGGCMDTNVTKPLQGQIGNLIGAGGTAFSAANNVILLQMRPVLNAVNSTVQTIQNVTSTTLGVVGHATHGLEAIQTFASKAWQATHADKIMAATTTVLTIHNGMMLSNNLLSTVSEATNVTLEALGIKDSTDTPIDIGAAVKGKIQGILTSLIGDEALTALTARMARANRIYQSSINVLDTTKSLFDSARTVAELTAENTGKIGNALKESGAVYEDAYDDFVEKINPQSAVMRKLDKFRDGLESIENVVDTVSQVSSEVVEIQENYNQLKKEKKDWKEEVNQGLEEKAEIKAEAKAAVQVNADINAIDFEADESTS